MEILGIDVGGSGIKGALVNMETGEMITERFRIIHSKIAETKTHGRSSSQNCATF